MENLVDSKMCEASTSSKKEDDFDLDEWEKQLAEECPELANVICFVDEIEEKRIKESTVSKKQQARDRVARLNGMMTDGRELFEQPSNSSKSGKWKTVLENMKKFDGPMASLARAVKDQKNIEVRTRNVNRIDRIFVGIPMSFDFHFNIALRSVRETTLVGRHSQREVGVRNRLNQQLPQFLKWQDGGEWPMKIGKNRIVQYRDQRACFIKGDNVVLVRFL